MLQQSTTINIPAKTPPPVDQTSTPSNVQNAALQSTMIKSDVLPQQQRLQLYSSLFGQEKNNRGDITGLQFTQSLNYSFDIESH